MEESSDSGMLPDLFNGVEMGGLFISNNLNKFTRRAVWGPKLSIGALIRKSARDIFGPL